GGEGDDARKLRAVAGASSDALLFLEGGVVTECNPRALEIFGADGRGALLGRGLVDLSPATQPGGERSQRVADRWAEVARAGGRARFSWMHRRLDGAEFPAEVTLSAVDAGGRRTLLATIDDRSERARSAASAAASERKFA